MTFDPQRLPALLDAAVPTPPPQPDRATSVLARARRENRRRAAAASAGGVLVLLAVPLATGWLTGGDERRLVPAAAAAPSVLAPVSPSAIGDAHSLQPPPPGEPSPPAASLEPEPTNTVVLGAPLGATPGTATPAPATPAAGYADEVRADRPVAYWRLDDPPGSDRAAAESIGGVDGGLTGGYGGVGDGPVRGVPGATMDGNTAAAFDGVLDTVSVTWGPALATGDTFTIEAWVQRTQLGNGTSGYGQIVVGSGNDGALLTFVDDRLTLDVYAVGVVTRATVPTTDLGVWHHVAVTKDGPAAHLYIDGVDVTGPVTDHTVRYRGTPLQIGGDGFSGSPAAAVIDEVAVYATALPPERIRAHVAAR